MTQVQGRARQRSKLSPNSRSVAVALVILTELLLLEVAPPLETCFLLPSKNALGNIKLRSILVFLGMHRIEAKSIKSQILQFLAENPPKSPRRAHWMYFYLFQTAIKMVLTAVPLHDIACPVVFIQLCASLPDFLGEAVAEAAEHYARTILPEYCLYKYAATSTNQMDEIEALASTENAAKTFVGDPVQTLAELPGPGKAVICQIENAINAKKLCKLKKQDPILKSLLPRIRFKPLLRQHPSTLPEPILAFKESGSRYITAVRTIRFVLKA
jgi:hypothetical protein